MQPTPDRRNLVEEVHGASYFHWVQLITVGAVGGNAKRQHFPHCLIRKLELRQDWTWVKSPKAFPQPTPSASYSPIPDANPCPSAIFTVGQRVSIVSERGYRDMALQSHSFSKRPMESHSHSRNEGDLLPGECSPSIPSLALPVPGSL